MSSEFVVSFGVPVAIMLFAGALLLYRRTYRFPQRPPNQVIPYLRSVDPNAAGDLLNPMLEQYLRLNTSKQQFKREQRHRLWLALEYLRRMGHNGLVMVGWGYYELKRIRGSRDEVERETCLELVSSSIQVRMCSLVLRARIHLWLMRMALLPFLPAPSVQRLVGVGSTDLLDFYQNMQAAASELSRCYGDLFHDQMTEALGLQTTS